MNQNTTEILSEVRGILDESNVTPEPVETGNEPERLDEVSAERYEAAAKLIDQGAAGDLRKMFDKKLDAVDAAFKNAKKRNDRMKEMGAGRTEATTFLQPVLKELRKLQAFIGQAVDMANKKTGLKEGVELGGMEFTQQGNGLWEEPTLGAPTSTPNNSVAGAQRANVTKGVNALMNASKGQVVKAGGVGYKVAQPAKPTKHGMHVVTLSGAYDGGRGDQYAMLIPPASGSGTGGTIKLVNIGSATPTFRDLRPDLTVESEQGEEPLASLRTDETQVWVPADLNEVALIVQSVFKGDEFSYHTEEQDRDTDNIKTLRRAVREGIAVRVESTKVPVHRAAAIVRTYDGLSIENQQKLAAMSIDRTIEMIDQMTDQMA